MDTVIEAPWLCMLGGQMDDPTCLAFLRSLHPCVRRVQVRDIELRYIVYLLDGIEIIHYFGEIVGLHLHVEPSVELRAWAGNLPLGLVRGMTREQVHRHLRQPDAVRFRTRSQRGAVLDTWRYAENRTMRLSYGEGDLLTLVTLSTDQLQRISRGEEAS